MRIRLLSLGITLVSVAVAHAAYAGPSREAAVVREARPVVIELFTSQGCSDCPAADALLTELSKRRDVIALSLPITYWDMLGWKDTFATEGNTQRQKAYARALNRSGIYTPQMIVDGTLDVVGNQRDHVVAAISARQSDGASEFTVPVSLGTVPGRVVIAIPESRTKAKALATIWVMRTLSHAAVKVDRGENRNHQLVYTNVVRDVQRAGEWNGEAMKIDLPFSSGKPDREDGIAVILQSKEHGRVIGAAALQIPKDGRVAAPR
jgi:hypothetical protein